MSSPERVVAAKFAAVDNVLWLEFEDGLQRAVEWSTLPFAGVLGIAPVAAAAEEHGRSVALSDAVGRQIDISSASLRAAVDAGHRKRIQAEDTTERKAAGARIRAVRECRGLSQEELSRRSGIPQESLSRMERGRRDPRLDTLRKLAEGCGLTLAELLAELSNAAVHDTDQALPVVGASRLR